MTGTNAPALVADRSKACLKNSMPHTLSAPRRKLEIVSDMRPNHIERMWRSSRSTSIQDGVS